jgi:hypothetical protein
MLKDVMSQRGREGFWTLPSKPEKIRKPREETPAGFRKLRDSHGE